jgi:hypothetical protein
VRSGDALPDDYRICRPQGMVPTTIAVSHIEAQPHQALTDTVTVMK